MAIVALVTACSSGGSGADDESATPVSGGTLTYASYRDATCMDPHVSPGDIVGELQRNVFDSLVAQKSDGTFAPWLASAWKISADGKEYVFTLRPDVKFFDGTPFDAAAVKANFEHILAPATKSQYAASLLGPYAGTDIVDDHTVRVRFTQPYSPFLQAASTAYLGFYSPKVLAEHPDELCGGGRYAVGSGPFRELSVTHGQGIEFERNPDYAWPPATARHTGPAYLDKLSVRYLTEDAVRTGALRGGQVDVIAGTPPADYQALQQDPAYRIVRGDAPGAPYTFFFNQSKEPFSDIRARQAVSAAIDIDGIVDSIYLGVYPRAYGPLSASTPGYDASVEKRPGYDVAKANRLLDELGYTGRDAQGYRTKDGHRFGLVLPYASNLVRESRDLVTQAVQQDLKKVGIELRLTPVDYGTYTTIIAANGYDLVGASWGRSDADVLATLYQSDRSVAKGGANNGKVADPQLDALLQQGRATADPAQRAAAYKQAQQLILDKAYALPIYVFTGVYTAAARVHGFGLDANGWSNFYDTWVDHS
ncbi:ABC transporter substrate-binding protein [Nocardia aobensis]|uniref:ABC transporter substrate-binding protein n=1 Tax=Nocardia aobensis TaxID=257277 RepID=UPI0002F95167|nr:ABC transporter substrate-binding protein [Nocardia aobensis]